MDQFQHLGCPCCKLLFGFQNTPKRLKNCQHDICLNCLKIQKVCPLDLAQISLDKFGLKSFLTNTYILQRLNNQEKAIQFKHRNTYDTLNRNKYDMPNKNTQNTFNRKGQLPNSQHCQPERQPSQHFCLLHSKRANLFCTDQKVLICSSCQTLGTHKGHNIISYQQILRRLTVFTDETYKLYQQIRGNQCLVDKGRIDQYIERQIQKKIHQQTKTIRANFKIAIEKVRKQQKIILSQLQDLSKQSIKSLKQNIQSKQYQSKRDQWVQQVHKLTSTMESVYSFKGIQTALLYLNQNSQQNYSITKGRRLNEQILGFNGLIKSLVYEQSKVLQSKYQEKFDGQIKRFCTFSSKDTQITEQVTHQIVKNTFNLGINKVYQPNIATLQQKVYCRNMDQKATSCQTNMIGKQGQPQQNEVHPQLSYQDLLLDSDKSLQISQLVKKLEITFQDKLSLMNATVQYGNQFTPMLRKQQDSVLIQDDIAILNVQKISNKRDLAIKDSHLEDTNLNTINFFKCQKEDLLFSSKTTSPNKKIQFYCQPLSVLIVRNQRSPLNTLSVNTHIRRKKIQIPQKYQQVWEEAKTDKCQIIDLTGAELGDSLILTLAQFIANSQKIKSIKLIRNKLTDEIMLDLISSVRCTNISSINLSQNNFTQKSLDVLQILDLGNIKNITLSLNKITLRKVKDRIENFKRKGITLSI